MKLTIFGATGKTGKYLVEQALQQGHHVTAFTRSPEKLTMENPELSAVTGDVRDLDPVLEAVGGADAVISVLGPTENKPTFAVTTGTKNILEAMQTHNVDRLIISAGAGVGDPRDEPKLVNRIINRILMLTARWVYEDMVQTVEAVRASDLDWTVVRVPMLVDGEPTGEIREGYVGKGMGPRITRGDLAKFILDQLHREDQIQQAPAISN
jgi:putative NADH-flavin reductase